jgi:hypothetical protein
MAGTAYVNQTPFTNQPPTMQGDNYANFKCDISKLAASFGGFVTGDTLQLVQIPQFAMLCGIYLDTCILDSDNSPASVIGLGDNCNSSHGGAGSSGFATGVTVGQTTAGTWRTGNTGFVHGTVPWIYSVPFAYVPANGIWLMLTFETPPATPTTTGVISGFVKYQMLAPLENASGTGALANPL